MRSQKKTELHRDGHKFGDRSKRQSIGDANRKRGSFKGKKAYRGQGR
jgi:hypothetical protein